MKTTKEQRKRWAGHARYWGGNVDKHVLDLVADVDMLEDALREIIAGFDTIGHHYVNLWYGSLAEKTHRKALTGGD